MHYFLDYKWRQCYTSVVMKNTSAVMSVRLSRELYQRIRARAHGEKRTVNNMVIFLIEEALKRRKEQ